MLFLSKNNINNEIFNVLSEHLSVKKIGKICKSYNKKIKLIPTNDKIPQEGYFMDLSKIKKKGFKFNYKYKNFAKDYILKS